MKKTGTSKNVHTIKPKLYPLPQFLKQLDFPLLIAPIILLPVKITSREKTMRKQVYICSPYSGDVETNIKLAREFSAYALRFGVMPIAPHLLFPQFMDDKIPSEREMAMNFNRQIFDGCEQLWVLISESGISRGMKAEIGWAENEGKPIRYFSVRGGKFF